MQRSNLAWVLLTLKALGIDNLIGFDFVSPPPRASLVRALELLYSLGALDDDCRLTSPIGATMAEFPVEPRLTRVLLAAGELGCSEEMLSIAACVSVQNVYHQPRGMRSAADAAHKKFAVAEGDHLTLLNIYNSFVLAQKNPNWCHDLFLNHRALSRAVEIRGQLRRYCRQFSIPLKSCENSAQAHVLIRKAIVAGFFANAAQLQPSGAYKPVRGGFSADDELHLHPTSVLSRSAPEWVVYHEVVLTSQKFMRDVTVVEPMWLCEIAPHFYEHKSTYVAAPPASSSSGIEKKEEAVDDAPPIKQRKLGGWV
jgi:ATP-dependent RNA helicase DDX35